jgi:hypothetical protein
MLEFRLENIMEDIVETKKGIHIMRFPCCQAYFDSFIDPSSPSFDVEYHINKD